MNIINTNDKSSLENAIKVLKSNGVIIFPTDTVYGIGCILDKTAIRKLYKIKNRPATQPTAILMTKELFANNLRSSASCTVGGTDIEGEFLNGLITIIFPARYFNFNFPKMILSSDNKIGIRLPKYKWLEKLIDKVGPIVASSANKKGEMAPANFADIGEQIKKEVDLVVESHDLMSGKPSAIFNISTNKLIR